MITLGSSRLQLQPFSQRDLILFHKLNTSPYIRHFLWDDEVISLGAAREILEKNERHFREDGFGLWKIILKEIEAVIGYAGLWYFFDEPQPQLIYVLQKPFAGQGYATEAAGLVVEYAFEVLGFDYLLAAMDESHAASQRVALRLGLQFLEKKMVNGKPAVFYRITNMTS